MGLAATLVSIYLALTGAPLPMQVRAYDQPTWSVSHSGAKAVSAPTGEKPESKLWWHDGFWWGNLYSPTAQQYRIHRLSLARRAWIDTGVSADDRSGSKGDVLWDGTHLYIVSQVFTTSASPTLSNWGRLYRYSYHAASTRYVLDQGFPVTNVTRGKSEALVLAKDSTGQLWVTYVEAGRVMLNHTIGSDMVWGEPFLLPVDPAVVTVTSDDIASVVAFQGNKIGVMWSNQNTHQMYFAVHRDADPDTAWQLDEAPLPGDPCRSRCADDHINLKAFESDGSGRVFAAIKTSQTDDDQPLVMLLVRDRGGIWQSHVFGRVRDEHTRPIVLLDEQNGRLYMFATAPESGGAIYYKSSDVNAITFAEGRGDLFIGHTGAGRVNNATSTKQNVSGFTGIVVLASDDVGNYLSGYLRLGNAQPQLSSYEYILPFVRR
ncbi:MAG: hypothetical protein RLZZ387_4579 [Chloroflexota bacterium]|jgi:hypothetical protein